MQANEFCTLAAAVAVVALLVRRHGLVECVIAFIVRQCIKAALPRTSSGRSSDSWDVKSVRSGLTVRNLVYVPSRRADGILSLQQLTLPAAEVRWRSWRGPLHVSVTGLRLELAQGELPQACNIGARRHRYGQRLQMLEHLLWFGGQPAGGWRMRQRSRLLRGVLAFVLRLLIVDIQDSTVRFTQCSEPGPAHVGKRPTVRDAAVVAIRSIKLEPGGTSYGSSGAGGTDADVAGSSTPPRAAAADNDEPAATVSSRLCSGQSCCFSASGVSLSIMTKSLVAPNPSAAVPLVFGAFSAPSTSGGGGRGGSYAAAAQVTPGGTRLRKRVRFEATPAHAPPASPVPAAGSVSPAPGAAADQDSWDSWDQVHVITQQWFAEVNVVVAAGTAAPGAGVAGLEDAQERRQRQQAALRDPAIAVTLLSEGVPRSDSGNSRASSGAGTSCRFGAPPCVAATACQLDITVSLKSLVVDLPPEASAVGVRMLHRILTYSKFATYWRRRPRCTVSSSPATWWQHAGNAVLSECRQHLPLKNMAGSLQRRRKYLKLYRAVHAGSADYVTSSSSSSSGGTKKLVSASAARSALRAMELDMTVAEIATYRTFVAVQHSRYLQEHPDIRQQWLGVLDMLGGFVDMIPAHLEGEADDALIGVALRLTCPVIGVKLLHNGGGSEASTSNDATSAAANRRSNTALFIEGISFELPSPHVLQIEADSAQVLRNFDDSRPPQHMLSLPMDPERAQTYGLKMDCSPAVADDEPLAAQLQSGGTARIYPDSLVTQYLSRLQVRIKPVEVCLEPDALVVAIKYLEAMSAAVNGSSAAGSAAASLSSSDNLYARSTSLQRLVLEMCKAAGRPVPHALSSFLPTLSAGCPQLVLRVPLRSAATLRSDALLEHVGAQHDLILSMAQLQMGVRYENSCYGSLLQQIELTTNLEVFFQLTAPQLRPRQAQYSALWMHPDDVSMLLEGCSRPAAGVYGYETVVNNIYMERRGATQARVSSLPGGRNAAASGRGMLITGAPPPSRPFLPVLKMHRVLCKLSNQLPDEPVVPGLQRSHLGLGAAGMCIWLSPWQMDLVLAVVEQVVADVDMLTQRIVHKYVKREQHPSAPMTAAAAPLQPPRHPTRTTAAATPYPRSAALPYRYIDGAPPQPSGAPSPAAAAAPVYGSSCLLDIPLVELLLFAVLPPHGPAAADAAGAHRFPLVPAGWLPADAPGSVSGREHLGATDHVMQWARRLTPVLSLVTTDLRVGAHATAKSLDDLMAQGSVSGLLAVDLQRPVVQQPSGGDESGSVSQQTSNATSQQQQQAGHFRGNGSLPRRQSSAQRVDQRHSRHPSLGFATALNGSMGMPGGQTAPLPGNAPAGVYRSTDRSGSFFLTPFSARARRVYCFARDRRRMMLGVESISCGVPTERAGLLRQRWRQLLEVRMMHRAMDYALFLLTEKYKSGWVHATALQQYTSMYKGHLNDCATAAPPTPVGPSGAAAAVAAAAGAQQQGLRSQAQAHAARAQASKWQSLLHTLTGRGGLDVAGGAASSLAARSKSAAAVLTATAASDVAVAAAAAAPAAAAAADVRPRGALATASMPAKGAARYFGSSSSMSTSHVLESLHHMKDSTNISQWRANTPPKSIPTTPDSGSYQESSPVLAGGSPSFRIPNLRRSVLLHQVSDNNAHILRQKLIRQAEGLGRLQADDAWLQLDYLSHFTYITGTGGSDAAEGLYARTPFVEPQVRVQFRRAAPATAAGNPAPTSDLARVEVGHVVANAGVHTISALLQLLGNFSPVLTARPLRPLPAPGVTGHPARRGVAVNSVPPALASHGSGVAPGAGPVAAAVPSTVKAAAEAATEAAVVALERSLTFELSVHCLSAALYVDKPRRGATPANSPATAGVLAVIMTGNQLTMGPHVLGAAGALGGLGGGTGVSSGGPDADELVRGRKVDVSITHIGIQDLQAAIEHRHVLSVTTDTNQVEPTQHTIPTPFGNQPALENCTLSIACFLPEDAAVNTSLLINLTNPKIVILRRFINNIVYTIGLLQAEVREYHRHLLRTERAIPGTLGPVQQQQHGRDSAARADTAAATSAPAVGSTPGAIASAAPHSHPGAETRAPAAPSHKRPISNIAPSLTVLRQQPQHASSISEIQPELTANPNRPLTTSHGEPLTTSSRSNSPPASMQNDPSSSSPQPPSSASPQPATARRGVRVMLLHVEQLQVVMPASHRCKRRSGGVKHAHYKEALAVNARELVLAFPGDCAALAADEFFVESGQAVREWMQDPAEVGELISCATEISQKHLASSAAPGARGPVHPAAGANRTQGAAGGGRPSATGAAGSSAGTGVRNFEDAAVVQPSYLMQDNGIIVVDELEPAAAAGQQTSRQQQQQPAQQAPPAPSSPSGALARSRAALGRMLGRQSHTSDQAAGRPVASAVPAAAADAGQAAPGRTICEGSTAAGPSGSGSAAAAHPPPPGDAAQEQQPRSSPATGTARAQLLFSVDGIEGFACTIVPGNPVPEKVLRRPRASGPSSPVSLGHAQLQPGYAWCSLQSLVPIIEPTSLEAALFRHPTSGATAIHLGFHEQMCARINPASYNNILKVSTDNFTERLSTFEAGSAPAPSTPHWNTLFNGALRFGPSPTDVPAFQLTVCWAHLQGAVEANPTWWTPELMSQPQQPYVPLVRGDFRPLALSMHTMRGSGNVHLHITGPDVQITDTRLKHWEEYQEAHASRAGSDAGSDGLFYDEAGLDSDLNFMVTDSFDNPNFRRTHSWDGMETAMQIQQQQQLLQLEQEHPSLRPSPLRYLNNPFDNIEEAEGGEEDGDDDRSALSVVDPFPHVLGYAEFDQREVPVVWLLRTQDELPANESSHLVSKGRKPPISGAAAGHGAHALAAAATSTVSVGGPAFFKVEFGYLRDGTMMTEVQLSHVLVQWPFMADLSMINALINVFAPWWGHPPAPITRYLRLRRNPWFYFNLLISESQVFVPFLSSMLARLKQQQQRQGAAPQPEQPIWFARLRDLFQQQMSDATQDFENMVFLEENGLALTLGAFRLGYFYGGDGESCMRVDLRNAAAFVRHKRACVTNLLLPLKSADFEWRCEYPVVQEHRQIEPVLYLIRRWVFAHRVRRRRAQRPGGRTQAQRRAPSPPLPRASNDDGESATPPASSSTLLRGGGPRTAEQQLLETATARAKLLLHDQGVAIPKQAAQQYTNMLGMPKAAAKQTMILRFEPITLRAAFSNVPFMQTLMQDIQLVRQMVCQGWGIWSPVPERMSDVWASCLCGTFRYPPPEFRRRIISVEAALSEVSLVLCDDKVNSFGAPDVLQLTASSVGLLYHSDARIADIRPEYAGKLDATLSCTFLNNSSSRWERMMEPWPVTVAVSDPINPIFKSSRTMNLNLFSPQPLKVSFHPASLLTIGDTLTFVQQLSGSNSGAATAAGGEEGGRASAGGMEGADAVGGRELPPDMEDQMAVGGSVTSRVPQRYLIHNQTGLHVWYWAGTDGRARPVSKKVFLHSYKSEELKVTPRPQLVKELAADGTVMRKKEANVISLQFHGNWMPLEEVAVDVVGKYRYLVRNPHGNLHMPVIVDVILVGRTKILKLHSALWLENSTDLRLCFRLTLGPDTSGSPLVLAPGDFIDSKQAVRLKPFRPKEGRFLPVTAALDGVLALEPQGYQPTKPDVVRLSPDVFKMPGQQGYIMCEPLIDPPGGGRQGRSGGGGGGSSRAGDVCSPLHFSMQVDLNQRTDWYFNTQNHVKIDNYGEFERSTVPLEAVLSVNPAVQLTNSLPYYMEGYLVSMAEPSITPPATNGAAAQPNTSAPAAVAAPEQSPPEQDQSAQQRSRFTQNEPLPVPKVPRRLTSERAALTDARVFRGRSSELAAVQEVLVQEYLLLLTAHKKTLKGDENREALGKMEMDVLKLLILRRLHREFRPLIAKFWRELSVLHKFEELGGRTQRITSLDLVEMIRWIRRHVQVVSMRQGAVQNLYVDRTGDVYVSLRVPQLGLQSKTTLINAGNAAQSAKELPQWMTFNYVGDIELQAGEARTRKPGGPAVAPPRTRRPAALPADAVTRENPLARASPVKSTRRLDPRSLRGAAQDDLPLVALQLTVVPDEFGREHVEVEIVPIERSVMGMVPRILLDVLRSTASNVRARGSDFWQETSEQLRTAMSLLKADPVAEVARHGNGGLEERVVARLAVVRDAGTGLEAVRLELEVRGVPAAAVASAVAARLRGVAAGLSRNVKHAPERVVSIVRKIQANPDVSLTREELSVMSHCCDIATQRGIGGDDSSHVPSPVAPAARRSRTKHDSEITPSEPFAWLDNPVYSPTPGVSDSGAFRRQEPGTSDSGAGPSRGTRAGGRARPSPLDMSAIAASNSWQLRRAVSDSAARAGHRWRLGRYNGNATPQSAAQAAAVAAAAAHGPLTSRTVANSGAGGRRLRSLPSARRAWRNSQALRGSMGSVGGLLHSSSLPKGTVVDLPTGRSNSCTAATPGPFGRPTSLSMVDNISAMAVARDGLGLTADAGGSPLQSAFSPGRQRRGSWVGSCETSPTRRHAHAQLQQRVSAGDSSPPPPPFAPRSARRPSMVGDSLARSSSGSAPSSPAAARARRSSMTMSSTVERLRDPAAAGLGRRSFGGGATASPTARNSVRNTLSAEMQLLQQFQQQEAQRQQLQQLQQQKDTAMVQSPPAASAVAALVRGFSDVRASDIDPLITTTGVRVRSSGESYSGEATASKAVADGAGRGGSGGSVVLTPNRGPAAAGDAAAATPPRMCSPRLLLPRHPRADGRPAALLLHLQDGDGLASPHPSPAGDFSGAVVSPWTPGTGIDGPASLINGAGIGSLPSITTLRWSPSPHGTSNASHARDSQHDTLQRLRVPSASATAPPAANCSPGKRRVSGNAASTRPRSRSSEEEEQEQQQQQQQEEDDVDPDAATAPTHPRRYGLRQPRIVPHLQAAVSTMEPLLGVVKEAVGRTKGEPRLGLVVGPPRGARRSMSRMGSGRRTTGGGSEGRLRTHRSTSPMELSSSKQAAAGFRCPSHFKLGINNTAAGQQATGATCRINLHAPYWVDNRSGLDLVLQDCDHRKTAAVPFLAEMVSTDVRAPGLKRDAALLDNNDAAMPQLLEQVSHQALAAANGTGGPGGARKQYRNDKAMSKAMAIVAQIKPVLLNEQKTTCFRVEDPASGDTSQACASFRISGVGFKTDITIKGKRHVLTPEEQALHARYTGGAMRASDGSLHLRSRRHTAAAPPPRSLRDSLDSSTLAAATAAPPGARGVSAASRMTSMDVRSAGGLVSPRRGDAAVAPAAPTGTGALAEPPGQLRLHTRTNRSPLTSPRGSAVRQGIDWQQQQQQQQQVTALDASRPLSPKQQRPQAASPGAASPFARSPRRVPTGALPLLSPLMSSLAPPANSVANMQSLLQPPRSPLAVEATPEPAIEPLAVDGTPEAPIEAPNVHPLTTSEEAEQLLDAQLPLASPALKPHPQLQRSSLAASSSDTASSATTASAAMTFMGAPAPFRERLLPRPMYAGHLLSRQSSGGVARPYSRQPSRPEGSEGIPELSSAFDEGTTDGNVPAAPTALMPSVACATTDAITDEATGRSTEDESAIVSDRAGEARFSHRDGAAGMDIDPAAVAVSPQDQLPPTTGSPRDAAAGAAAAYDASPRLSAVHTRPTTATTVDADAVAVLGPETPESEASMSPFQNCQFEPAAASSPRVEASSSLLQPLHVASPVGRAPDLKKSSGAPRSSGGGGGQQRLSFATELGSLREQNSSFTPSLTFPQYMRSDGLPDEEGKLPGSSMFSAADEERTQHVQRLYQFSIEVWSGPANSAFAHTKIISIKSKYILLNDTGLAITFKQKGTPDPETVPKYGPGRRFAGQLQPTARCSLHWDNASKPLELVIRPRGRDWYWSGSFPIPDREDYFGLRIRNKQSGVYKIIPVNITVGRSGSVLITLKSESSIPPYRIENRCKDIVIHLKQSDWIPKTGSSYDADDEFDALQPKQSMPYAWDEPMLAHTVAVQGTMRGGQHLSHTNAKTIQVDEIKDHDVLMIPLAGTGNGVGYGSGLSMTRRNGPGTGGVGGMSIGYSGPVGYSSQPAQDDFRTRVENVLAAEFAKKVYVSVYADGPTRVLCFSDAKNISGSVEDENSALNLSYRLQQVGRRLRTLDRQLATYMGMRQPAAAGTTGGGGGGGGMSHGSVIAARGSGLVGGPLVGMGSGLPYVPSKTNLTALLSAQLSKQGGATADHGRTSTSGGAVRNLGHSVTMARQPTGSSGYGYVYPGGGLSALHIPGPGLQSMTSDVAGVSGTPHTPETVAGESMLDYAATMGSHSAVARRDLDRWGTMTAGIIGGDLTVKLAAARNLGDRVTAAYAQLSVAGQVAQSPVVWHTASPAWELTETFRDVAASCELTIEVWSLPGGLLAGFSSTQELYKYSTFLGCVQIPLAQTLPSHVGSGRLGTLPSEPQWHPLTRKTGSQRVQGEIQVAFEWQFTDEGLLLIEVAELERLMAQKLEILALLRPVPHTQVTELVKAHTTDPTGAAIALHNQDGAAAAAGDDDEGATPSVNSDDDSLSATAAAAAAGGAALPSLSPGPVQSPRGGGRPGGSSTGGSIATRISRALEITNLDDGHYITLEVEILQVRNLVPRKSWDAGLPALGPAWASLHEVLRAKEMPHPIVKVACESELYQVDAGVNSLNPHFPKNSYRFENVSLQSALRVQLLDMRSSRAKLLGQMELPVAVIPGTDPVYMWLPLQPPAPPSSLKSALTLGKRRTAHPNAQVEPMQVFARFQIGKPRVKGAVTTLKVNLAGVGVLVKTDSNDELLNCTVDSVQLVSLQTKTEHQISALVRAVQIDNQMLETRHPVVLSPSAHKIRRREKQLINSRSKADRGVAGGVAAVAAKVGLGGSKTAADKRQQQQQSARSSLLATDKMLLDYGKRGGGAAGSSSGKGTADTSSSSSAAAGRGHLIRFSLCRSYSAAGMTAANVSAGGGGGSRRTPDVSSGGASAVAGDNGKQLSTAAVASVDGSSGAVILSFRKLEIELGAVDFETDQAFLEALYLFSHTLPMSDLHQDEDWRKRIQYLQGMQGADRRPAQLSTSSPGAEAGALSWLVLKQEQELAMMKGQSSTWFFLEQFILSDLSVNVTIALSSSFGGSVQSSGAPTSQYQRQIMRGMVQRITGDTGFQLINVSNVPIQLKGVGLRNRLVNKVALSSLLQRHYSRVALKQAPKVMGGAGPAIAQIPASVVWATYSLTQLTGDLASRERSLEQLVPGLSNLVFMFGSQIISALPRTLLATMAFLPVSREGEYSDHAVLQRWVVRPQTAGDAFQQAFQQLFQSLFAGLAGTVLDPVAGAQSLPGYLGMVGFAAGLAKGLLGLGLRPASGLLESTAKIMQGVGLLCLGKEGIQGRLVRRVRGPGSHFEDAILQARVPPHEQQAHDAMVASWQDSLYFLLPQLNADIVSEVLASRANRVVLLSDLHVAYLRAHHSGDGQTSYKRKWVLAREHVDHVRGVESSLRIVLEYRRPVSVGRFSVKVPLRKSIRCVSPEVYQRVILRISHHLSKQNTRSATNAAVVLLDSSSDDDHHELLISAPAAPQLPLLLEAPPAAAAASGGASTSA